MPALASFNLLASVPTHYDRFPAESGYGYGTRGKPATFRANSTFKAQLDACFSDLQAKTSASLGTLEVIASAGAYVEKPGYHGSGRAFDLDALFWKSRSLVTRNFPNDPMLYIAVESVLRKHFGTILNYDYNVAHQDHFHIDNGSTISFQSMSKSRVTYLQYTLKYVFGLHLSVDGVYGPITKSNLNMALQDTGLPSISTSAGWLKYLDHCADGLLAMV